MRHGIKFGQLYVAADGTHYTADGLTVIHPHPAPDTLAKARELADVADAGYRPRVMPPGCAELGMAKTMHIKAAWIPIVQALEVGDRVGAIALIQALP